MMKFRAFLTHNPQDFFDGTEDYELCEEVIIDGYGDEPHITKIFDAVAGGYKAILFLGGDNENG